MNIEQLFDEHRLNCPLNYTCSEPNKITGNKIINSFCIIGNKLDHFSMDTRTLKSTYELCTSDDCPFEYWVSAIKKEIQCRHLLTL